MRFGNYATAAGMLALGLVACSTPAKAQGPTVDRLQVDVPYPVTVGDKTLPPGKYEIRQLRSNANTPLLEFYSEDGKQYETSAMAVPIETHVTPDQSKVILGHTGPDYYFHRIWVQGKDYGYELPMPASVKERQNERMAALTVSGHYQPAQPPTTAEAAPPPPPPQEAPPPPPPQAAPPSVAHREMPKTSSGWLTMLLGGGALSGLGLMLRRRRIARG